MCREEQRPFAPAEPVTLSPAKMSFRKAKVKISAMVWEWRADRGGPKDRGSNASSLIR